MRAQALIFDLDGTLLDTEMISGRSIAQVTQALGKPFEGPIRKAILGRPSAVWTRMVIADCGLEGRIEPRAFAEQWEANMAAMFHEMEEMPGATAFLRRMHARGIPMALATSSSRAAVEAKRKHHEELFSYFSVIVCGDDSDVKNGKPAPDIFLTAARRLLGDDVDPSRCIVFEDSVLGVAAGRAAGMITIALPDPRFYPSLEEQAELFAAADERITRLDAFDPDKYML
ncbi:hypothetical protein P43SY_009169 [Pythium insidiosum]|uniref:Uncharacterized protein n=1 Tax=Pythium insidiosum TaxID=114742 RepID=A0AAD5M7Y9_PYTIN|nr:hypothetical protein P43SY_009169 [Pythium insidiosum]